MLKIIIASAIFFMIAALKLPSQALAYPAAPASSATLATPPVLGEKPDERIRQLRLFLASYNSPLENLADEFVTTADKYQVDWKLVPAITGVESTFGRFIPVGSYNAYGWNNGNFYFQSWPESIEIVTKALKENYIDRGADTVWKIGPIYAPPSKTWAAKVNYFMNQIENYGREDEEDLTLTLSL